MKYAIVVLLSYLMGSSNMAYWVSKIKNVDIRANGTGNLGASNATVLLGWGAGVIVAVHDIAKAFLAVLFAKWMLPEANYAGAMAGVACVLGHIYPFYQGRQGSGIPHRCCRGIGLAGGACCGGSAGGRNADYGFHRSGYHFCFGGHTGGYVVYHP